MSLAEYAPWVGAAVAVIIFGAGIFLQVMSYFIRREFTKLDDLSCAITGLAQAVHKLGRWKTIYTAKTDSKLANLTRANKDISQRISNLEAALYSSQGDDHEGIR
jgi:hypothetical protein